MISTPSETIFNFNKKSKLTNWTIINDDVMGGKSSGSFHIDKDGYGVFKGHVSLENNGGFSLLHYRFKEINTTSYTKVVLRVKGDGKLYQFRVKKKFSDHYAYIGKFTTTNDWETIEIKFNEMYPAYRGKTLDMPNYANNGIEEIAFLIGNKKTEDFMLMINTIVLK